MHSQPRILLVDDDPTTLALTAEFLASDGEVVAMTDAAEALRAIVTGSFEILVTDLKIQHSFDGLLLASAMRYIHPTACTVLMTGLPDFTRAIREVQGNVDFTLLKPVGANQLREAIATAKDGLAKPATAASGRATVWELIDRHRAEIMEIWHEQVSADTRFEGLQLSREERLDHLPELLRALNRRPRHPIGSRSAEERRAATQHGQTRKAQGYLPHWLSLEASYLRRVIVNQVLNEIMEVDLASFQADLLELYERLDDDLLDSLQAFGLSKT